MKSNKATRKLKGPALQRGRISVSEDCRCLLTVGSDLLELRAGTCHKCQHSCYCGMREAHEVGAIHCDWQLTSLGLRRCFCMYWQTCCMMYVNLPVCIVNSRLQVYRQNI